ncbi:hypothetical protein ABMA28_006854 [Loxostege sticticalis]|uniref:Protein rolling stone n=1 Tax=Loxostege sticticalis TaxID=481309 RepID=A0ABD0TNP3_LOXSC
MGVTKQYFKDQFRVDKLTLNHEETSDFYVSCWQTDQSPLYLLCVRLTVFLGCASVFIASMVLSSQSFSLKFWPIYMTHWGVFMIMATSGLALIVSIVACIQGSIDLDFGLPWYVRLYWAFLVITVPLAYYITIFYYSFLTALIEDFAVDPALDFFVHAFNSIAMFILLITSKNPVHILQFVYPFVFAVIYMVFSIIYYYSGGTNPYGEEWIYPMLDWSNPGPTTGVVFACAALMLIVHSLVVLMALFRDYLVSTCITSKRNSINIVQY